MVEVRSFFLGTIGVFVWLFQPGGQDDEWRRARCGDFGVWLKTWRVCLGWGFCLEWRIAHCLPKASNCRQPLPREDLGWSSLSLPHRGEITSEPPWHRLQVRCFLTSIMLNNKISRMIKSAVFASFNVSVLRPHYRAKSQIEVKPSRSLIVF